jgi:hypothetical protein
VSNPLVGIMCGQFGKAIIKIHIQVRNLESYGGELNLFFSDLNMNAELIDAKLDYLGKSINKQAKLFNTLAHNIITFVIFFLLFSPCRLYS